MQELFLLFLEIVRTNWRSSFITTLGNDVY
jgi:hypothetical protein